MSAKRDFEDSEMRLRALLIEHRHSGNIIWAFHEDFVWDARTLYVNPEETAASRLVIANICNDNARSPFGVELRLVTEDNDASVCSVVVPSSQLEAELMLTNGIKLLIPHRLPVCRIVSDQSEWRKIVSQSGGRPHLAPTPIDELARRATCQSLMQTGSSSQT